MSSTALQHYDEKIHMAEDLFAVHKDERLHFGTKIAVANQVFDSWSEWHGKIKKGGRERLARSPLLKSAYGRYWSLGALQDLQHPAKSNMLRFEHAVPRSILRACLNLASVRSKQKEAFCEGRPDFQSADDLYQFLEQFCFGVVMTQDEQRNLDCKERGLRSSMGERLNWSKWKEIDSWMRYRKFKQDSEQVDFEILDRVTGKTCLG